MIVNFVRWVLYTSPGHASPMDLYRSGKSTASITIYSTGAS